MEKHTIDENTLKLKELLVSVVVPIYNAEATLYKCIESILRQSHSWLQIILVNDGSTDKSGSICADFTTADVRVELINKANEGVSSARNIGLTHAKGTYLIFVDSDDYIEYNMIEVLLAEIVMRNADIVFHGLINENANGGMVKKKRCQAFVATGKDEKRGALIYLQGEGLLGYACNKMYRLTFLRSNLLFFPIGINLYEDLMFNIECYRLANCICGVDFEMYHYVRCGNSLATTYNEQGLEYAEKVMELLDSSMDEVNVPETKCIEIRFGFALASVMANFFSLFYLGRSIIHKEINKLNSYKRISSALKNGSKYIKGYGIYYRLFYRALSIGNVSLVYILQQLRLVVKNVVR